MIILKTKRLSICVCNFVVLKDEITEIDRPYRVLEDEGQPLVVPGFEWRCGGCGRTFPINCVMAQEASGEFAPLPADLFREEVVQS